MLDAPDFSHTRTDLAFGTIDFYQLLFVKIGKSCWDNLWSWLDILEKNVMDILKWVHELLTAEMSE